MDETLPALRRLQATGKVRFVGITGYPLKIFREVLARVEVDTILSYCHYELNNTRLLKLVPILEAKQVGIISASPLGMGLLTQRGTPAWHPATAEIKAVCAQATAYCTARGVDIARLAVQFALAEPRIHSTLIGTANPDNLHKNLAWLDEPLDEKLLADVRAILAPIADQSWPVGRPENS